MRALLARLQFPGLNISVKDAPPKPQSTKPFDQLKLLHQEVDRELGALSQRRSGMHTRATILVAASGVLATVQTTSWDSLWQLVGVFLSLVAAGFGLLVLRPWPGVVASATLHVKERLNADPYSTEYSIVMDNILTLEDGRKRTERLALWLVQGFLVLVLAWVATLIVAVLEQMKVI
jgi:hypothetical protein